MFVCVVFVCVVFVCCVCVCERERDREIDIWGGGGNI